MGEDQMPFEIIRNDIVKMHVDVIVNAANIELQKGGGVCGAIFDAAGDFALQEVCDKIGGCEVGGAVITDGFNSPAKYIIHAVGPVWSGGSKNEPQLLASAYKKSLELALKNNCESIAFPLISSGIYGYPKDLALRIAIDAISAFLMEHEMQIYLVVFDKKAVVLSERLYLAIHEFIDDYYVDENERKFSRNRNDRYADICESKAELGRIKPKSAVIHEVHHSYKQKSLEDVLAQLEETFAQRLFRLIDESGMTDVMTYKRANIDRRLFSKLKNELNYNPSKVTAIAFAIALELNLDDTKDLLSKAGYTLSRSSKFDLIIEYFIQEGIYNIFEINEALFAFDQTPLGA